MNGVEKLPWCPNCECYSVPNVREECGECDTVIIYKEGQNNA